MSITGLYPVYYFQSRARRETELLADQLRVLTMRLRRHFARRGAATGIDLAPMLDFVLNLLIFFIITAVFVKELGIQVDAPRRRRGRPGDGKETGSISDRRSRAKGEVWSTAASSTCARCAPTSSGCTR